MQLVELKPGQRLLTVIALVGTALAIAFLFVGVGHSLIVLSAGRVAESNLAIEGVGNL